MNTGPGFEAMCASAELTAKALAWPKQTAAEICTAPIGKYRIVHVDPRDHWPTKQAGVDSVAEVRNLLNKMTTAERQVMAVHNDQGQCVDLQEP